MIELRGMATASKNKAYLKLSVEKRLALIEEIWKSIQKEWNAGSPMAPSEAEKAELDALMEETATLKGDEVEVESACKLILDELKARSKRARR